MLREQEQRRVHYDRDLEIGAYQLSEIVQKFPSHFHDLYVIGFIEGRKRHLWCKNQEYDVSTGDLLLFNPRGNHCCEPLDGEPLNYRAVNINPQVMERFAREITGKDFRPYSTQNVVYRSEIARSVITLYDSVLRRAARLEKEKTMFFLLEQVLQEYASPFDEGAVPRPNPQIQFPCTYMEKHSSENISLGEFTEMITFGRSYLLQPFTKQVGVSPCHYLQAVRLDKAEHFLEQGIPPMDTTAMAGFSDQSHFTNFFKEFIGLTPRQYQRIFSDPSGPAKPEKGPRHEL